MCSRCHDYHQRAGIDGQSRQLRAADGPIRGRTMVRSATPSRRAILAAGSSFILRAGYSAANNPTATTLGSEIAVNGGGTAVTNTGLVQSVTGDITLAGNSVTQAGVVVFHHLGRAALGSIHLLTPGHCDQQCHAGPWQRHLYPAGQQWHDGDRCRACRQYPGIRRLPRTQRRVDAAGAERRKHAAGPAGRIPHRNHHGRRGPFAGRLADDWRPGADRRHPRAPRRDAQSGAALDAARRRSMCCCPASATTLRGERAGASSSATHRPIATAAR